jgi:hypothetical protein
MGSEMDSGDEGPPCIGLSRDQWIDKCVSLLSSEGIFVAIGIVRASQPQDFVDSSPLRQNNFGIYILESIGHPSVPEDRRCSVRCWPIRQVIYDGVCLFFQLKKYDCMNCDRIMTCSCLWQYNSTRRRRIMSAGMRLERRIFENSILSMAGARCCSIKCTQYFPREVVVALRTEMWSADHALRKHMKLQVHRNAYEVDSRKVVSLENYEVCLNAWYIIHSIPRADFYQFKRNFAHGMHASHHRNQGTKKRHIAT